MWFKSTDGDRFLSEEHEIFYKRFIKNKSSNFLQLVQNVGFKMMNNSNITIPISDALHIWKNIRSRYLTFRIGLFATSPCLTEYEDVKKILNIGKALDDNSQLGKMRDNYVLKIFTFQNIEKLLKNQHYLDAVLFLPFACWIAVVFSTRINLSFRLFLTELAFQLIGRFHRDLAGLRECGIKQKGGQNIIAVTFAEEQYIIRMQNTLLAIGISLVFGYDFLRLDALGTHLVENSIGIARQTSNDPRWERILSVYAHAELRKKIAKKYGIKLHVQRRINYGGCKIDEREESFQEKKKSKPDNWSIPYLLQLVEGICNPETLHAFKEDLNNFINDIGTLGTLIDKHEYDSNEAANNGIIARLISFKPEYEKKEINDENAI